MNARVRAYDRKHFCQNCGKYLTRKDQLAAIVGEIAELSNWISTHSELDVFTWYYGHTNSLDVRVHSLGFYKNKIPDLNKNIFIKEDFSNFWELEELVKELREIVRRVKYGN